MDVGRIDGTAKRTSSRFVDKACRKIHSGLPDYRSILLLLLVYELNALRSGTEQVNELRTLRLQIGQVRCCRGVVSEPCDQRSICRRVQEHRCVEGRGDD